MHNLTYINNIPTTIKFKFSKYFYQKLDIVGYKYINSIKKIPIIELFNYTRVWILPEEIKIK